MFALFYCLLDVRSGECNVISLYVLCCPVNGSVCFVCCVFVNCLVKQFAMFGRVRYFVVECEGIVPYGRLLHP